MDSFLKLVKLWFTIMTAVFTAIILAFLVLPTLFLWQASLTRTDDIIGPTFWLPIAVVGISIIGLIVTGVFSSINKSIPQPFAEETPEVSPAEFAPASATPSVSVVHETPANHEEFKNPYSPTGE